MSKRRVTFEVDNNMLFDMLSKMKGDTRDIGSRVIGVMMGGDDFITAVGMAAYGITVVSDEVLPPQANETPS